jgi:hypothetical protein
VCSISPISIIADLAEALVPVQYVPGLRPLARIVVTKVNLTPCIAGHMMSLETAERNRHTLACGSSWTPKAIRVAVRKLIEVLVQQLLDRAVASTVKTNETVGHMQRTAAASTLGGGGIFAGGQCSGVDFGPATFTTARAPDGVPTIIVHPPRPIEHVGNVLKLTRSREGVISLHL